MDSWCQGDIITIHAGTGAGKSHWVKHSLYEKAKSEGKKILFLLHRLACIKQFQKEIDKDGKSDVIKIKTYQGFDHVADEYYTLDIDYDGYIVSDECHYFISDAGFNDRTDKTMRRILDNRKATKIFMSATANWINCHLDKLSYITLKYDFEPNFDFISNLFFFNQESSITDIVDSVEGKVLLFINKRAMELKLSQNYDDALFYCGKGNDLYPFVDEVKIENIFETGRMPCNKLFTTSALDTGLNLIDENLNTIIISNITELAVIKQCIGRRRHGSVNVYIHNPHPNTLYYRARENDKFGEQLRKLSKHGLSAYLKEVAPAANYEAYEIFQDLGYIEEYMRDININRIYRYEHLSNELSDYIERDFTDVVSEALDTDYSLYEEEAQLNTILSYLNKIKDKYLMSDEKEALIQLLNVRGSNNAQRTTRQPLNDWLNEKDIPFIIDDRQLTLDEGRRRYWIVREKAVRVADDIDNGHDLDTLFEYLETQETAQ